MDTTVGAAQLSLARPHGVVSMLGSEVITRQHHNVVSNAPGIVTQCDPSGDVCSRHYDPI